MVRDTCRMPGCDDSPGLEESDTHYNKSRYCSVYHELKYEDLKMDAQHDRQIEQERRRVDRSNLPEYDGPPY